MQTVILTAGFGTRLQKLLGETPKSLALIGGVPLIDHQLQLLSRQGLRDIIICTGYQGQQIQQYCGNGQKWNVSITYSNEKHPTGTATTLNCIEPMIRQDFLLFYGDLALNMDFQKLIAQHKKRRPLVTLTVQASNHSRDCDLIETDLNGYVTKFIPKNRPTGYYPNLINGAVQICDKKIFKYISDHTPDFDRDVLPLVIEREEKILAYRTAEYVQDIGTEERYKKVNNDFALGRLNYENLNKYRKAIFLDRDGTINRYIPGQYITNPDGMELLPGVASAIKKINDSDYLVICLTNQGVIAKKQCGYKTMGKIHNKMETLLAQEDAYLDRIYLCPHHQSIAPCECRKPKIDMLVLAKNDYNIDSGNSFMIGDTDRDIEMAHAAGLTAILVKSNTPMNLVTLTKQPDLIFDTLKLAVDYILNQ